MQQQTISHSPDFTGPWHGTARRPSTGVRIAAFRAFDLLPRSACSTCPGDFTSERPPAVTALEPLMLVLNPWRLSLLFLVSGVGAGSCLRKYAVLPLLRSRNGAALDPAGFRQWPGDRAAAGLRPDRRESRLSGPALSISTSTIIFALRPPQFCPNPCILLPTWNPPVVSWPILWVYTMAPRRRGDGGFPGGLDRAVARAGAIPGVLLPGRAVISLRGLPARRLLARLSLDACRCSATGIITALFCGRFSLLGFSGSAHAKSIWDCHRAAALDRHVGSRQHSFLSFFLRLAIDAGWRKCR